MPTCLHRSWRTVWCRRRLLAEAPEVERRLFAGTHARRHRGRHHRRWRFATGGVIVNQRCTVLSTKTEPVFFEGLVTSWTAFHFILESIRLAAGLVRRPFDEAAQVPPLNISFLNSDE